MSVLFTSEAEWRDTPYPGYRVSSEGQITGPMGRVLLVGYGGPGRDYAHVACRKGNIQKVHVLVCEAFHGPRPAGLVVRHLNGNSKDNRATNLQWGTRKQNEADKIRHGTNVRKGAVGLRNSHCKLSEQQVLEIRARYGTTTVSALAREYDVTRTNINDIAHKRTWRHL